MKYLTTFLLVFTLSFIVAQQTPDFTVTDSDGVVHSLYADHLDKGQTVVLKLFFTSCPPCISLAPWMEEKYQSWGAGEYDVEFIELSTQSFDSNEDVAQFKTQYGLTFPGVGADGGSKEAAAIYQSGDFGQYWGTPSVIIIAPDGTVTMDFNYDDFDDLVAATGATGMSGGNGGGNADITTFSINTSNNASSAPSNLKYILKPENSEMPQYDILALNGGSLDFDYPSTVFPEIENPVIVLELNGDIVDQSVNALDLLKIRKHILDLDVFTTESQLLAADINSDGNINALDLLNLQRALLELITIYPNGTPAWKTIPEQIPLSINAGQTVDIDFQLVKIGNIE